MRKISGSKLLKKVVSLAMVASLCMGLMVSASAAPSELDDETKATYYAEYLKIAAEVNKEMDAYISVNPMDEFAEEDWMTPEEFREFVEAIAGWKIVCTSDATNARSVSATKTCSVTADSRTYTIAVTGTFSTKYSETYKRQAFSGINSITSEISGSTGTWTQTGYESSLVDAGRTYCITVSGTLKIAGATFSNKLAYVEFVCSSVGAVS